MTQNPKTLASHLEHLAADADDIVAMLTLPHSEKGDIHPEALAKSARLQTSLREVIFALTHHDRLAMKADDVWSALSLKHDEHDTGVS